MSTDEIIKKDLIQIKQSINRIETALLGDEGMKIEGIAKKVSKHEKYISNSKQRLGIITGLCTGLGFIFHQIIEWVKFKFFHT